MPDCFHDPFYIFKTLQRWPDLKQGWFSQKKRSSVQHAAPEWVFTNVKRLKVLICYCHSKETHQPPKNLTKNILHSFYIFIFNLNNFINKYLTQPMQFIYRHFFFLSVFLLLVHMSGTRWDLYVCIVSYQNDFITNVDYFNFSPPHDNITPRSLPLWNTYLHYEILRLVYNYL